MKRIAHSLFRRPAIFSFILAGIFCLFLPAARAGLTVDIHLYHDQYGYYDYAFLSTNTTPPNNPLGNYLITSPQSDSSLGYQATTNGFNYNGGEGTYYNNFDSFLYGITNGQWSIGVTNATSTNLYRFTVTVTGVTSNSFGAPAIISFPADGSQNIASQPVFQWSGPAVWAGDADALDYYIDDNGNYNFEAGTTPSDGQTSWVCPVVLPDGTNQLSLDYSSNVTTKIVASVPLNGASQAISGWISTATLETSAYSTFVVGSLMVSEGGGHTNVAYYSFEDDNVFAYDFSGHGNKINGVSYYSIPPYITNNAAAGNYAFASGGDGWLNPPTNLLATLSGSFSIALWIKTSEHIGNDNDNIYSGAGIVSALDGGENTVVPMALTGSKLAFYTGGSSQDTLYSQTSINTGRYVHVVVTRDQTTGEKKIYINGTLDTSDFGATDLLTDSDGLDIGYNNGNVINGELDDIEFYSGVLSATEVQQLYNNPGTTIPDEIGGGTGGLVVHYDFDENEVMAPDVSGNGNNIIADGNNDYYDGDNPVISNDSISGAGSVSFDGDGFLTPSTNLLSTIAGTFSLSLWVNTTDSSSYQGDVAWDGACIVSADSPDDLVNGDIVPVALTGGQVAFNTGTPQNGDDTLHSYTLVNDGQWHHVVIVRNQSTGEKDIYVDGELDNSDYDTTNLLNDPQLLTIGCKADATNPDPNSPSYTGGNGYTGLTDDIQLYNRVISASEVNYLYENPGGTLNGAASVPYPVDASVHLLLQRSQDPNLGEYFSASISFDSVSPAPTTTNSIYSPNGYFNSEEYPVGGRGSSSIFNSLGTVLNEITNGSWKIYINQGSPTQEVYSFQIALSGIDTNFLKAARILNPTNGSIGVPANAGFVWNGPTNYSSLNVGLFTGPDTFVSLPLTTTNWTSSQALTNGSQTFYISYNLNDITNAIFTTPVNAALNPIDFWSTSASLNSEAFSAFTVSAAGSPVLITNLRFNAGALQFSYASQTGSTNTIQYRTNLVAGAWQTYTNIPGDGTVKNPSVPVSAFGGSRQGFIRVSTQ